MVRVYKSLLKDSVTGIKLSKTLLEMIVCPLSKQPLRYCEKTESLVSDAIGVSFPLDDSWYMWFGNISATLGDTSVDYGYSEKNKKMGDEYFASRISIYCNCVSPAMYIVARTGFPKGIFNGLDSVVAKFIWMDNNSYRHLYWVAYNKIALPINEGVPARRRHKHVCKAFKVKYCWCFVDGSSLWGIFMCAKYSGGKYLMQTHYYWYVVVKHSDYEEANQAAGKDRDHGRSLA